MSSGQTICKFSRIKQNPKDDEHDQFLNKLKCQMKLEKIKLKLINTNRDY